MNCRIKTFENTIETLEDQDNEFSEDGDDDDIDVGDWIGLELNGKEYFGEIVEFDDDEGTVTIETEDGEEINRRSRRYVLR